MYLYVAVTNGCMYYIVQIYLQIQMSIQGHKNVHVSITCPVVVNGSYMLIYNVVQHNP